MTGILYDVIELLLALLLGVPTASGAGAVEG